MLHPVVEPLLKKYVQREYVLSEKGMAVVYEANRNLSEAYFEHLEFPVSRFWFKYFSDKINLLPPEKHGAVLDVCAGSGTVCLNIMSRKLFETCCAVDISEVAVRRLEERIRSLGTVGVQTVHDNIMHTRFEDNSFDCVVGNSFLHHLPDNVGFLREMHRILRPGGTICLTGEPTLAAPRLEGIILDCVVSFVRQFRPKPQKHKNVVVTDIWLYERTSLAAMLKEVGYDSVKITPFGFLVPLFNGPSSLMFKKMTGRSMQPDWWWQGLGEMDRWLFSRLLRNSLSHFVIAARKPRP